MKNILVSDVMTRDAITVKPSTNLLECARKMVRKRVGSLLIVYKKRFAGFISERDILWVLIKKSKDNLSEIKAIDISPRKIVTIKPSSTIKEVTTKMRKTKFDKLPVVHENELVGIITVKDILNFNPEIYPELEEFAQIKEREEKLKRISTKKRNIVNEGNCEKCGEKSVLRKVNERFICESCEMLM
jgi:CBS domain-containing protein/ribosomal protein S27AE|tara:strand:- start:6117 stop:6677 length:561 start_codon:yes stop_codon:yes gene_type:complete